MEGKKINWTFDADTGLRNSKPGSVEDLQKHLKREGKGFNWSTLAEHPFKLGVAKNFPREVVAWCTEWLRGKGLEARFIEQNAEAWAIIVEAPSK